MPTNKIRTSINVDSKIMENIKIVAMNKNKTQTEIINNYLKQGLLNEEDVDIDETLQERIDRLGLKGCVKIANKKTYKRDSDNFKTLIGSVKAPKNFDVIKSINEIHNDKA